MTATASASFATASAFLKAGLGQLFHPARLISFLFMLYFLLFWLSLVGWVWQDMAKRPIEERLRKVFLALVIVFNLLGVLLYLVWRPPTCAELEKEKMEEEILRLEWERLRREAGLKDSP